MVPCICCYKYRLCLKLDNSTGNLNSDKGQALAMVSIQLDRVSADGTSVIVLNFSIQIKLVVEAIIIDVKFLNRTTDLSSVGVTMK